MEPPALTGLVVKKKINQKTNLYIYIYIYIYIHIHMFRPSQDSSVWLGTHQVQTGNKNVNVYVSFGILGEPEHGPDLEAITFFPALDFGIT